MIYGQFMDFTLRVALVMLALASVRTVANAEDATSKLQNVAKANSLDAAGKPPFHLKMTFQMYDLAGQASDTGTVEEWWAAPGLSKIAVTAASLKSNEAVELDSASGLDPRERYFIEHLLSAAVRPAPMVASPSSLKTEERDRAFSGITLNCFDVAPAADQGAGRQLFSYCAEKNTDALRFQLEGTLSSTARNQIGSFHDTEVALGLEIAYSNRLAITGKVTALQTFDPAKSAVQLSAPLPEYSVEPGSLAAGIVLDAAAMDAVKQWTYQPFLLNGRPVEVNTVININFMFGGGR